MKLEVGMLIRTKEGIRKIEGVWDDMYDLNKDLHYRYPEGHCLFEEDIEEVVLKASHNIIDLMEENDLIKIEYYSERYKKRVTRLFEVTFKEGRYINLDNAKCQFLLIDNDWANNDKELKPIIKSIVTKQQMESMQYEVK